MERNSSIFNSKALPKGFLVFVLMVLCFESAIRFMPDYIIHAPPFWHSAICLKSSLVEEKNDFDILILGDSAGWAGIRPRVLDEKLALKTYNLSLNLVQTHLMSYVLLKRYLANCVRKPKFVIIEVSSLSLLNSMTMTQSALSEYILPYTGFLLDLFHELTPELRFFYLKTKLLQMIPSIKNQFIFQDTNFAARVLFHDHFKDSYDLLMNNYKRERGFYNENLGRAKRKVEEVKEVPDDINHFDMASFNTQYLKKILRLLNKNEIDVVLTLTPVRTDVFGLWNKYSLEEKLQKVMDDLCNEYSIYICIRDMRDLVYPNDLFVDSYHLSAEGADLFTEFLSARIRGQKKSPNAHSGSLKSE